MTRDVRREISIAAPVGAVWKALTDAEELTRWFPPVARVEPGVGGSVSRVWQSGEATQERIERWDPNRHLRTVGLTSAWKGITTDYHLTTGAGSTVIRVVSSGFSDDAEWDSLYEAFGGGWDFELRGLRHYLENHRGLPRRIALARATRPSTAAVAWSRLMDAGGWAGPTGLRDLASGTRYAARPSGDDISGVVQLWQPPHQFAATVDQFNNAYLRVDTRCLGETGTPWIWLSAYGVPLDTVQRIEQEWQTALDVALA